MNGFDYETLMETIAVNLRQLATEMQWSQVKISQYVGIAEATVSNYLKGKRMASVDFLVQLCNHPEIRERGLEVTPDMLMDKDFDPCAKSPTAHSGAKTFFRDMDRQDLVGNYICYFFDQSKALYGQEEHLTRELRFGVASVFESYRGLSGDMCINAKAVFFKQSDGDKAFALKAELDELCRDHQDTRGIADRNRAIEAVFADLADPHTVIYSGAVTRSDHHVFLNIYSANHGDQALIILYAPRRHGDDDYLGGLGSVASVACGRMQMPSGQKIIMSKVALGCSDEEIAQHLCMPPEVDQGSETRDICKFCSKLYAENSPLRSIDEADKEAMLQRRLDQVVKNYLEKNVYGVGSVSEDDDLAVCRLIDRYKD